MCRPLITFLLWSLRYLSLTGKRTSSRRREYVPSRLQVIKGARRGHRGELTGCGFSTIRKMLGLNQ